MKRSALFKNAFREIWSSKARFLSIFSIILLGVGFFVGIKATGPDMINSVNRYYHEKNLMDIKVVSVLGMNQKDVQLLSELKDVNDIQPGYSQDVLINSSGEVAKVYSYKPGNKKVNQYEVINGRMPKKSGEIALDAAPKFKDKYKIGDTITFKPSSDKDDIEMQFKKIKYKVVGFVNNPQYIETIGRGNTDIGKGTIDGFAVIPEKDFNLSYFTEIYLTFKDLENLDTHSDTYKKRVNQHGTDVKKIMATRPVGRMKEYRKEAEKSLEKGREKVAEMRQELQNNEAVFQQKQQILSQSSNGDYSTGEIDNGIEDPDTDEDSVGVVAVKNQLKEAKNNLAIQEVEQKVAQEAYNNKSIAVQNEITKYEEKIHGSQGEQSPQNDSSSDETPLDDYLGGNSLTSGLEERLLTEYKNKLQAELATYQESLNAANQNVAGTETEIQNLEAQLAEEEASTADNDASAAKDKRTTNTIRSKNSRAGNQTIVQKQAAKFQSEKAKMTEMIERNEKSLAQSERNLKNLGTPHYYTFNRSILPGYNEYDDNAERISALATVFPIFFFVIAALVSLTTMTRMVEEQRQQIGTFKALGYHDGEIAFKFIFYAFLASILGSFLGLIIGYQVFPRVIFNAYKGLYNIPDLIINWYHSYATVSIVVALLCTVVSTLLVLRIDLRSEPASLMQPKAPKMGKRILLEKVTPIWRRLNFNQKVTMRNLFLYKSRMFMTIIGIAGCMALIVTGFGLRQSIAEIVPLEYDKILKYDATVSLRPQSTSEEFSAYQTLVEQQDKKIKQLFFYQEKGQLIKNNVNTQDVFLEVPKTPTQLKDYFLLNDRVSQKKYKLSEKGVLVTEKLADLYHLKTGENFEYTAANGHKYQLKVAHIIENYANHMIFMHPATYEKVFETKPIVNTALLKYDGSQKWADKFADKAMKLPAVQNVSFLRAASTSFSDTMDSLNIVVLVLIVSAAALAFIVLYNLTNINISERIRELSTIKVLGFYNQEVSMYIFRENFILTSLGIILGGFLGRILHIYVLKTAEVDLIMFDPKLYLSSYLYAGILTFLFSIIVMFVMHIKLKNVDMIEALKAND